jgi:hypothetical protein
LGNNGCDAVTLPLPLLKVLHSAYSADKHIPPL